MSGSNSGSIAAIKYAEIERVGIHKHQTFVANLMKWIRTHADRDYWISSALKSALKQNLLSSSNADR